jgi:Zn finger protein HypA/HybF involved in hydrogenase expression
MELKTLQGHIRTLASLPETRAPVVSCYLRVEGGRLKHRRVFSKRIEELRRSFAGEAAQLFEEAIAQIERFLSVELQRGSKGVAVYSRSGRQPFFLALQFYVPLPTWIAADTLPNIYHLVELKDTYWRFVVLVCSQDTARIVSVNLGAVTLDLLRKRPELRERVGREWTKEHFRKHRTARTQQFIGDAVKALSGVMTAGSYDHLILAGEPKMTAMVRGVLPPHVAARLSGVIRKPGRTGARDVVAESIASFVEAENKESQATAEELQRQLRIGGLAVAGTRASYFAVKRGQVETLVMSAEYSPRPGWVCRGCRVERTGEHWPKKCPACGSRSLEYLGIREAMLRLAEQRGCQVELVRDSTTLRRLGGVGCLLRFRPEQQGKTRLQRGWRGSAVTPASA